jgi:peroxiredoxin
MKYAQNWLFLLRRRAPKISGANMMRRHVLHLLLATSALFSTATNARAGEGDEHAETAGRGLIGTVAPRRTLKTIDGETIDLGAFYGKKAVYLKFWATWCEPCREQMPHFQETFERAGSDLAVIAINAGFSETVEDVRAFKNLFGLKMPMVIDDGALAETFHLRVTPQHVVIGRDGRVQYVGHSVDARLEAALTAARKSPGTAAKAAAASAERPRYAVGDRVGELSAQTVENESFRFADPDGKRPTVLMFFATFCESYLATSRPQRAASCRVAREKITALSNGDGARWLGIAWSIWTTPEGARDYRTKHRLEMPMAIDTSGALFHAFRVTEVPVFVVIDREGRVAQWIDGDDASFAVTLERALRSR